ncbi:membrane protein [Spirochaetia bacterium]|nr:membrane protein [Spirochaetia bacterium]
MNKIMRRPFTFLLFLLFFTVTAPDLWADEFFYKHAAGDKYRILSSVQEDVYINRVLSHRAEILNRIAVSVESERNGLARHRGIFQTAEQAEGAAAGRSFQWSREYESVFDRDRLGYITIDKQYYMPVVRNVPVFPGRDLKPGDTWTAEGHETHDFRTSFGIEEPYVIPFTAEYTFTGYDEWKGKTYPVIAVSYRILDEPPPVKGTVWPRRILGSSAEKIYWDSDLGQARGYRENFRMIFELSNGNIIEYRGTAEAELLESEEMNKEQLAGEIQKDLEDLGIDDISVRVVDGGVSINLENIQFGAESAALLPSEQAKLDQIGAILKRYANRDIQVGGHTALAGGSAASRRRLSEDRARAVADYLIGKGVRGADRILVQGFGAERPLGDNRNEEGRRRNRRVEITILEN